MTDSQTVGNVIGGLVLSTLLLVGNNDARATAPDEPAITDDDRQHWSFRPVVRPAVSDVVDDDWCRTPVDRFILAELEERGLQPMPQADRRTVLRRVTFDLTGLPPTLGDVDRFLQDEAPGAYERVVDRLLASPAYGERWGQHWLDLARFAETDGFEHDKVRPNAWRYRDWVIRALNADMSYDDFVRLQLAGDQVRPDDPAAAIATGFLLCGPDMPDINLQQERRHNFLNDMTGTVGSVFLALQVQCAACHNHKYDPLSQADFYRLRAFFDSADIFGERAIPTAEELIAKQRFEQERADQWKALETEIKTLRDDDSAESHARSKALKQELADLKKAAPPAVTMGRVVSDPEKSPGESRLWIRGDFRRPGPELEPAFVRVADLPGTSFVSDDETSSLLERRDLAEWLVDDRNPLTARVMVNRIWQHHFGMGLAASASDFGVMGDWPTHPELLDWLAAELVAQDWSLKAMHRLLVTSSVYRSMSHLPQDDPRELQTRWDKLVDTDPRNELLGRMRRQRLDGEAIRDAMLTSAGQMNRQPFGPGVRPPLPEEVTGTLLKNQWPVTESEADARRRSIYLFVRRNLPYPLLAAFDRPDTNQSCPRRNETTIAPQALHLLNSNFAMTSAEALSARIRKLEPDDPVGQIELAYRLTLSRPPSPAEQATATAFVTASREDSLVDFCLALFNVNEFVYVD